MRNILFKIYVIISIIIILFLLKTKGEDEVDKWRRTLEIILLRKRVTDLMKKCEHS